MSYRISGHETFSFRYTWLPKAVRGLAENSKLFSDDDAAMVKLGVGKNMVRSIRFWSQAAGITETSARGMEHKLTDFGKAVLGEKGFDPFLEDVSTLWLLHWKLSTNRDSPLFAWDYLLNRWQDPDIVPSAVLKALRREAALHDELVSDATLEQHIDTFLHTYVPTRGRKGDVQEDNLDCPLVELQLVVKSGDRELDGKRESIYGFRREEKPDITPELFVYCLNDFWMRFPNEKTIPLAEVAHGHGSPGQIFKIPEEDIRNRVDRLQEQTRGQFTYQDSAALQSVQRKPNTNAMDLLENVYATQTLSA